jgi:hypothetical protein
MPTETCVPMPSIAAIVNSRFSFVAVAMIDKLVKILTNEQCDAQNCDVFLTLSHVA